MELLNLDENLQSVSNQQTATTKKKSNKKRLQKEYDKYLKAAKTYELDGDLTRAKLEYENAVKLVPQFKKSKQNEKNLQKLKKKLSKLHEKITNANIRSKTKQFGNSILKMSASTLVDLSTPIKTGLRSRSNANEGSESTWEISEDAAFLSEQFSIDIQLYKKLYNHQKTGIAWLHKLYMDCTGGILADDMGLGKTMQVISFISGLLRERSKRRILIVAPASLLPHWRAEINRWDPSIQVGIFSKQPQRKRNQELAKIIQHGGVMLTNYEKIWHSERSSNIDLFTCSTEEACKELKWKVGKQLQWATVVLDEGHRIKNHNTGIFQALSKIHSRMRLVLSGTPFQNNLNELWAIFTYISDGKMFPSLQLFRKYIGIPIERGEKLDSTAHERRDATYKRQQLHMKIQGHILRREKGKSIAVSHEESSKKVRKHDVVVWIPMTTVQQEMYRKVLESSRVENILLAFENEAKTDGGNILLAMNELKQVCDGTKKREDEETNYVKPLDEQTSCKLGFLKSLLEYFKQRNHRTLIFSKFTRVLDAIELMCVRNHFESARIDGNVKHEGRQEIVDSFNHDGKYDCMLLTTGVGAVGLTLTGADRVVIFGPDWNPAVDNQAVDRAFRIGQQHDVMCYRLMTCNTIEEKMYRRQVFKEGLVRSVIEDKSMNVYSSGQDLSDVFELNDPGISNMQEYLAETQKDIRHYFEVSHQELCMELENIQNFNCYGISHHDVLFDEERKEDENEKILFPETPQQNLRQKEDAMMGLRMSEKGKNSHSTHAKFNPLGVNDNLNEEKRKKRKENRKKKKKKKKKIEEEDEEYTRDKFGLFDDEAEEMNDDHPNYNEANRTENVERSIRNKPVVSAEVLNIIEDSDYDKWNNDQNEEVDDYVDLVDVSNEDKTYKSTNDCNDSMDDEVFGGDDNRILIKNGFYKTNDFQNLSRHEKNKFAELLKKGKQYEDGGEKILALDCYIDCLNISDENYEIHRNVLKLADETGMLNEL
jgi:SNF2 family DNA or RNA helicase